MAAYITFGFVAIDGDVDGAGVVIAAQHLLPRVTAINTFVHAAFTAGRTVFSECRDINDVRIRGMNADLGDGVDVA